jgi:hypothetical protein
MTYNPNSNWTSSADATVQTPIFFLRIDGVTSFEYSTHPVKSPTVTKKAYMRLPTGGGVQLDFLEGTRTQQEVTIEILDVDESVTLLISTEAPSAPVTTLINRKATVYMGFAGLVETDYAPVFAGRIVAVERNKDHTGYRFVIADALFLTDAKIMTNATDETPSRIIGNVVNVYYSILTGSFLTSGDFPLLLVVSGGTYTAPTGLGIDPALINIDQLISERENYHSGTIVDVCFNRPENAKTYLQKELFRTFQCWPAMSGAGLIGLRFLLSPLPTVTIQSLTETDHIVEITGWKRAFDNHLNKFRYLGDYENGQMEWANPGDFNAILYDAVEAEDSDDQTATLETVEYLVESQWLKSSYDGATVATMLAGRMRSRFLKTPARLTIKCNITAQRVEEGDIVRVTHRRIPDIQNGVMGVTERSMIVLSTAPDFDNGLISLDLIDVSFRRYGLIGPDSLVAYASEDQTDKDRYAFLSDNAGAMSNADQGYRAL